MTERRYVATPGGQVHIACAGDGPPLLLLHQTPRSWDEYRDVLPLLAPHFRAIAMDTPGFGASDALPAPSIEGWAATALAVLDALAIPAAFVAGHHTGAVIALEMAARAPERVRALVLSSCPFVDASRRAGHEGKRVIDEVDRRADGSHLTELWARRRPFYPEDAGLLERFVADALRAGDLAVAGHRAVNRYRMEDRLKLVGCPTLVLDAAADPHAHPSAARVAAAIEGAVLVAIEDGMVPLPDGQPVAFACALRDFLAEVT